MADWVNICPGIYVGTDITLNFTIYQSGTTLPQDITGWSIQFVIHPTGSETNLVTKTIGSGVTIISGPAGQGTISIAAADTASIAPATYLFRIERTDTGSDEVLTIGLVPILAK